MSVPGHNLDEVRAALLGAGFDVPRIVLASWNQRQIHQACSWAKWTREPWKHGLAPRFPRILERFDARVPHCQRAGGERPLQSAPAPHSHQSPSRHGFTKGTRT